MFIKLHCISFILIVLCILSRVQSSDDQTVTLTPIQSNNIENDFQYTLPIEVAKRMLQQTPITTGTGQTLPQTPLSITKYTNLTIYHQIPTSWIIGQIFQVRGKLNYLADTNGTYVCFSFISTASSSIVYTFKTIVPAGTSQFTINVDTRSIAIADYYLALYPTLSGSYYLNPVYQLRAGPTTEPTTISAPATPTQVSLSYLNNKLILKWNQDSITPIQKVTFQQNGQVVEFILSNFQSTFDVPFKSFVNFTPGSVNISIASAYSSLNGLAGRLSSYSFPWTATINAVQHAYGEIKNLTLTKEIPWIINVNDSIIYEGISTLDIKSNIVIQQPGNQIGEYNISSTNSVISANTLFSKALTFPQTGLYIVEINNVNGEAVLNRPVYVGTSSNPIVPLIPDYIDLNAGRDFNAVVASQPTNIDTLRNNLLYLINQKRGQWGVASLTLDNDLNNLAQGHSNDMASNNYISHVNLQGLDPNGRAQKAGLNYSVGQNLAKNIDLTDGHNGLCRSPGHLKNIVLSSYTRIGLGIAKDSQGYLLITQNFAGPVPTTTSTTTGTTTTPTQSTTTTTTTTTGSTLSATDIENLRIQVRNWITTNYVTAVEDTTLSNIVITWQRTNTTDSIFTYTWNTAKYPSSYLASSSVTATYSTTLVNGLVKNTHLKQPDTSYVKFGVGVVQLADGRVKLQAEYAK